jgi:two-component system chemotaxis response regulator CheB
MPYLSAAKSSRRPNLWHRNDMNSAQRVMREIVVIGGSAGALKPLKAILEQIPGDFPAAIFVTIHIPADFPSLLPRVLNSGPLTVKHPEDQEQIRPGTVYIAPPDFHLLMEKGRVHLSRGARENRHRPAIDPMFRAAARFYGPRVIGIILSGHLDDGSSGLMAVKMRGGLTAVQKPDEALSPQMPQNAINYAHPEQILPAAQIASWLIDRIAEPVEVGPQVLEERMAKELEDESREADLQDQGKTEKHGTPSPFACPECHGVLWEIEDGPLLRFRCRVGHAYTADALRVSLSEYTEEALWASMRVMEEKAALLRRMAPRSSTNLGGKYLEEAQEYDKHVKIIRKILIENQDIEEQKSNDNVA